MSVEHQRADGVELVALAIFAGAITSVCGDFITRLARSEAEKLDLIDEVREKAMQYVKGAVTIGVPMDKEAEALRRALSYVEDVGRDWRGESRPVNNPYA